MSQPHVLVVEDEPAQREVLSYNLEAEGFRVTTAGNGEDGLLMVQEDPPDVMVLDWMLPSVSGIEVCRQLKARPDTRAIPIIMLSARSEDVDRVRGLETGAITSREAAGARWAAISRHALSRSMPNTITG